MSFSNRDVLNRRIEADRAEQQQLETVLHDARLARDLAAAAMADAQARLIDCDTVVTRIGERFTALTSSITTSKLSLLRSVMESVSEDVLRLVFQHLVHAPDQKWRVLGNGVFNKERARAPFVISAVCRQWRRISCDDGGLWTYLAVPSNNRLRTLSVHGRRVNLLIDRSKTSNIDVFVNWTACELNEESSQPMQHILTQLVQQSLRWRRVELTLPSYIDRGICSVLRGPTPNLEQLSIVADDASLWNHAPECGFLPYAPRLWELELSMMGIFPSSSTLLPSLRTLRLWHGQPCDYARTFLDAAHSTVESLYLGVSIRNVAKPITLKRLTSLTIRDCLFIAPQLLLVPRLSRLFLHSQCVQPEIVAFLDNVANTVTHLTLFGSIQVNLLEILSVLRQLTNIRIVVQIEQAKSTVLDENFWGQLADADPPIWPRLTHLSVGTRVQVIPLDGYSITHLLAIRNGSRKDATDASDGNEEGPARLQEVALEYQGVPHWVTAEVSRLLVTPPHVA